MDDKAVRKALTCNRSWSGAVLLHMTHEHLQKLIDDGSCEKALSRILKLRKVNPQDLGLAILEGVCRTDLGDYADAAAAMIPFLDRISGYSEGMAHLVFSLARLGRVAEAERLAKRLLGNPEATPFAFVKAAEGLTHARPVLARRLVMSAIRKDHEDPLSWVAWSVIIMRAGHPRGAHEAVERAIRVDPEHPTLHEVAFWSALDADRPAVALSHAMRVPPRQFQSTLDVSVVLELAKQHLPPADRFIARLRRRLKGLKRSKAGAVQAFIESLASGGE